MDMLIPMQFCPPHFGAGSVHVRTRDLFPVSHVTLHGCHGNHWLHSPFTINQLSKETYETILIHVTSAQSI